MEYEKISVFEYFILKHKVPSYLYDSKLLKKDIDKLFDNEFILRMGNNSPEKYGEGFSTCGLDNNLITSLTNIDVLLQYINTFIVQNFYKSIESKKIFYTRIWSNKIYKNCSGKCHSHGGDIDGTGIFYYNAPIDSSKLIVLRNKIDGLVLEDHKNISYNIVVQTGDLIIHEKNVPHAISKHLSDDPRICFVFDYKLV